MPIWMERANLVGPRWPRGGSLEVEAVAITVHAVVFVARIFNHATTAVVHYACSSRLKLPPPEQYYVASILN